MKTRALLTIDTELAWRHGADRAAWEASFVRSYEAAGVGVPYQLRMLAQFGLKACFFVDPMPACVFGPELVRRMIDPILAAGQEVQLHLHPNWKGGAFELTAYDEAEQRALIAEARDLLMAAGAPAPIAFRAGSYAADDCTLRALAALGLRYDSSHNGGDHPWPSAISLPPAQIAPVAHQGVIEVPVTQIGDGTGLRPLQICAVSTAELNAALDHAIAEEHQVATIISHSFELATRDGRRVNLVHRRRFDALCAWLSERRGLIPTVHLTDLEGLRLGRDDRPLPHNPVRRFARHAEQLWSNQYHERRA